MRKLVTTIAIVLLSAVAVSAKDFRTVVFKVNQMECQNCEKKIRDNIKFEKGLKEFSTNLEDKTVTITYDAEKTDVEKLQAGFKKFKYQAEVVEDFKKEASSKK